MTGRTAREVALKRVKIEDGFWSNYQNLVKDVVIPYQEKILNDEIPDVEKSHALENFRIAAGESQGEFYGMVFQDSDVAKWLEAVAYSLTIAPDEELESRADAVIDLIGRAQQPDGYLNTYFTVKEPEHRWENLLECHELYCAGHMMEAAVAYYEATGKKKLVDIMERMADHIADRFGPDKVTGIPGHQEIEIGLMRMYHVTGQDKYRELAQYFLDERGKNPDFFIEEAEKRDWGHSGMKPEDTHYNQSFAPVREQKTADGHSVRAVYMYTAMADLAGEIQDEELLKACDTLWDNIVQKRMYITGGIGSTVEGEAFSIDYDLPNDTVYAETCASIGLIFFAKKMLDIRPSGRYADVMERALYNGVISGIQLDGKKFFYVNPLEVNPGVSGELYGYRHVLPERPGWYECACCPPNVARLLTSLGRYAWSENDDTIWSHLYVGGTADLEAAELNVQSDYPWEGHVKYSVEQVKKPEFTLAVRIPSWVKDAVITVNGKKTAAHSSEGYVYLKQDWQAGDQIEITFEMKVRRLYANTAVRADAGCVALMRGPFVYCFEEVDNGGQLQALRIPEDAQITAGAYRADLLSGIVPLEADGLRVENRQESLYSEERGRAVPQKLQAVPYYAWGNRGLNQMRIWMLE